MTKSHVWFKETRAPNLQRPSFDAFFSYAFRPFFLGAAVFAALMMSVWLAFVATSLNGFAGNWLPVAGSPFAWHAHEMIFGFSAAAIAGFLLTAVPNWTGALPISGAPLIVLFAAWLAGRVGMAVSGLLPYGMAATLDLMFLPMLGAAAARQLFVKPAARNLVFLLLVAAMTLGNVIFHLGTAGRAQFRSALCRQGGHDGGGRHDFDHRRPHRPGVHPQLDSPQQAGRSAATPHRLA